MGCCRRNAGQERILTPGCRRVRSSKCRLAASCGFVSHRQPVALWRPAPPRLHAHGRSPDRRRPPWPLPAHHWQWLARIGKV